MWLIERGNKKFYWPLVAQKRGNETSFLKAVISQFRFIEVEFYFNNKFKHRNKRV
jgi:hypothetical protein